MFAYLLKPGGLPGLGIPAGVPTTIPTPGGAAPLPPPVFPGPTSLPIPGLPGVPPFVIPGPAGPIVVPGVPGVPAPVATLATYIIQPGDFPAKLAQRATGTPSRWTELRPPNPNLKTVQTKDASGKVIATHLVPFNAGQILNVPASWPPPTSWAA